MKQLRFKSPDSKRFANVLRTRVNEYFSTSNQSSKGSWKMLVKIPVIFSFYVAPFIVLLTVGMPWWFIFWLSAIMGFGLAAIGMGVMHDAAHGSLSEKRWLNKLMSYSMYALGGSTLTWKIQHNYLHHTFTNIEGHDEDLAAPFFLRFSPHKKLRWIHRFQFLYAPLFYCFLNFSKIIGDFFQLDSYARRGLLQREGYTPWKEQVKLIGIKFLYASIFIGLPILFTDFTWWQVLLGWVTMQMVAGFIMAMIFQLAHVVDGIAMPLPDSENTVHDDWTIHQLNTTANFARKNPLITFFAGGLNYQIEHHLFPQVSHVHYPRLSKIVEQTANEFGLKYQQNGNLFSAIGSHFKMLWQLGRVKMA